jgi:hypothetical protein
LRGTVDLTLLTLSASAVVGLCLLCRRGCWSSLPRRAIQSLHGALEESRGGERHPPISLRHDVLALWVARQKVVPMLFLQRCNAMPVEAFQRTLCTSKRKQGARAIRIGMVATVVRAYASMPSLTMDQIVAEARKGRRSDGGDRLGTHPQQRIKDVLEARKIACSFKHRKGTGFQCNSCNVYGRPQIMPLSVAPKSQHKTKGRRSTS